MSVSQTEKMSPLKIPNSNRTPYTPKYSSATKDKVQFSTLKANEIFLDAWLKIPDQSLPVSQLTSQHLQNKLWYRENSVPIVKYPSGPLCSSSTSVINKTVPGEPKESKSPHVSPREEGKTKDSKTETDNSSKKNLAKSGVRPRICIYSNGAHMSSSGFVSQQERAKSTLDKIMRKRIYEKERYKNDGIISPRVSENLRDFGTSFFMANIQPISQRGCQRLRNNHHSRNNFQDRLILRNTNIKWNLPNTLTCLDNFDQQQTPHSGGVAFKDFKILPLPSVGPHNPMTDSPFAQKILGSNSLTVRNYWKSNPSHIKIT